MAEPRIQNMVRNSPTAERSRGADWREQAACADPWQVDPEWWYSNHIQERERAKQVCATCPVFDRCAEAAQDETFGVWAGKSRETTPNRIRPCITCGRITRPSKTSASDYPNTMVRGSATECQTCHRHVTRKTLKENN